MKHGLITCDLCGATGAKTCYFYVDRKMDPAGSMEDEHEQLDLCDKHTWSAYQFAEHKYGFELANFVYNELKKKATQMTEKRRAMLATLKGVE